MKKSNPWKALLLTGVAIGVFSTAISAQASAMEASPTQVVTEPSDGIADIVVTAQRRNESMQQVPIAITALSADDLSRRGLGQSNELVAAVPGLEFNPSGGNGATPFIRGVGATNLSTGFESPVAIYLDDAYVGAPPAGFFSLGSISSVEILKGPQGTLFGRNATGGVIQVRTKNPSQTASGNVQAGYGNYDTFSGNMYLNTPLTDTLAVNLAVDGLDQRNGYGRNLTTGLDIHLRSYYSLRSKALWAPSGATTVLFTASYSFAKGDSGLNTATLPGSVNVGGGLDVGRYNSSGGLPADGSRDKETAASLKIDHDFGEVKLTSISAARNIRYFYSVDQDGSIPFVAHSALTANTDVRSQEIHLASSNDSALTWLVGLYYFHSRAAPDPLIADGSSQAPFAATVTNDHQNLNSYSGFADATYKLDSGLSLTLGVRYTKDDYQLEGTRDRVTAAGAVTRTVVSAHSSFSKFTYRGVLAYQIDRDAMLYLSRSRGFKSGGYNLFAPTGAPVAPEILDATEAGFKTEWLGRRLRINGSAFNYDYTNLQVTQVIVGGTITLNAGKAHIWGGELDFETVPFKNLSVSGGISLQRGRYTDFPAGPFYVPNPQPCPPAAPVATPLTGGNRACSLDLKGRSTVQTPPVTLSLATTYTMPTASGDFGVNASYYYNDGFYWDAANQLKSSSYSLLNASLSWTSVDHQWNASIWGKNLGNTYYQGFAALTALRSQAGAAPPRTYGVTIGVNF